MSRDKKLKNWINKLPEEEMRKIIFELVDRMIDIEEIGFYDGSRGPYWDASGDRLYEIEDCN
jgi:hypothetical protein